MNAAVFVDFENLFASLHARSERTGHRTRDLALTLLENLKTRLHDDGCAMVLGRSYAAFDTYPGMEVAHDLALMGFDPQYVLVAPSGRNSADVQLAVDVCRVLFRRADIETIVIVSGDRDFIPIARQVLEENRALRLVAMPDAACGDLRMRVGRERFLSALDLLPPEPPAAGGPAAAAAAPAPRDVAPELEVTVDADHGGSAAGDPVLAPAPAATPQRAQGLLPGHQADHLQGHLQGHHRGAAIVGHIPVTWRKEVETHNGMHASYAACLELIVKAQVRHGSREIWLSPFLKGPMSQQFSNLVHTERRALINELRSHGAIRVEERENHFADHPYSVIVLQEDHDWVRAAMARMRRG